MKILNFSIFHGIKNKKCYRTERIIKQKISNSTYNKTSTYNRNLRVGSKRFYLANKLLTGCSGGNSKKEIFPSTSASILWSLFY